MTVKRKEVGIHARVVERVPEILTCDCRESSPNVVLVLEKLLVPLLDMPVTRYADSGFKSLTWIVSPLSPRSCVPTEPPILIL